MMMMMMVYDVPYGRCDKTYVDETSRQFGTRLKEHQKDMSTVADVKFPEQIGRPPLQSSTNLQSQTMWPKKNTL